MNGTAHGWNAGFGLSLGVVMVQKTDQEDEQIQGSRRKVVRRSWSLLRHFCPPCLLFPAHVTGSNIFPLKVLRIIFGIQSSEWGTS